MGEAPNLEINEPCDVFLYKYTAAKNFETTNWRELWVRLKEAWIAPFIIDKVNRRLGNNLEFADFIESQADETRTSSTSYVRRHKEIVLYEYELEMAL